MLSTDKKHFHIRTTALILLCCLCFPVFAGCAGKGDVTGVTSDADITSAADTTGADMQTEPDPDTAENTVTDTEPQDTDTAGKETTPTGTVTTVPVPETTEPEAETTKPETTVTETADPETTVSQTTVPETTEKPKPLEFLEVVIPGNENGIVSFFKQARYCEVDFTDDESDGKVLRITTKNAGTPNTRTPSVYFDYQGFCASVGKANVDISSLPAVVMKVKTVNVHDRKFGLLGAATLSESAAARTEAFARIPSGDGWHYICFDFTKAKKPNEIAMFRLCFEQLAGGNGESILISEIRFCTAADAAGYAAPEVYTVQEQTADDYTLRLLQFNIQTENGNSAPFIVRSELYRQLIDQLKPDVVGMEEVTVTWRKWLDEYVFNGSYTSVGEPRSSGGEANPIYYRKDKFDLIDSGTFWLSDTPEKSGSLTSVVVEDVEYKANYPRICTWALLRDKSTGIQFVHINTHLDHNGNNSSSVGNTIRKAQIKVIIKFAQRFKGTPMFLSGDLNNRRTTGEGKTYALIKMISGQTKVKDDDGTEYSIFLDDSRLKAPVTVDGNHIATMTKYYDESSSSYDPTREPIDYVFYDPQNTDPLTYETFLISENGLWISDHLPVFTTFRISK